MYYSDIKEKFPEGTELDKDFHSIALMQSCYAQAVGLCKVDTDNVIEELFSNIAFSLLNSQVPLHISTLIPLNTGS